MLAKPKNIKVSYNESNVMLFDGEAISPSTDIVLKGTKTNSDYEEIFIGNITDFRFKVPFSSMIIFDGNVIIRDNSTAGYSFQLRFYAERISTGDLTVVNCNFISDRQNEPISDDYDVTIDETASALINELVFKVKAPNESNVFIHGKITELK